MGVVNRGVMDFISISRMLIGVLPTAALIVVTPGVVSGQDYPSKPIRILVAAAGSGNDFDARQIAQGISAPLGQPVIVDNRPQGPLAAEAASKAPPDGHTLLLNGAIHWIFPLLQKAPYDIADFSPISLIERSFNVVVVHPSLPVKSIKELIALAKARPGVLNYASGGVGGATHLSAELFKSMAGVNIVYLPYKATAAAMAAVIGGEAQMMVSGAATVFGPVKSGRLRPLAVTSAQPTALVPDLPTVAASGLPGYESVSMTAMFTPARTPRPIINRLNQEIVRFLNKPDVKEIFFNVGVETVGSSPEELAAVMKSETVRWGNVIKANGIKVE